MAKQKDLQLEGTYDGVIFYKWRGKYCMRAKGLTGKQSPVARQQASVLGQASALSARIRRALKPLLPGPANRPMMYRLNHSLQQWLRTGQSIQTGPADDIAALKGFSFSPGKKAGAFYAAMPVSRSADGNLVLHIPAFDSPNPIHPLPFDGNIRLHIMAVSCKLDDAHDNRVYETNLDIQYTGSPLPAQDLLLPIQTMPGCINIVALGVNGMSKGVVGAVWN